MPSQQHEQDSQGASGVALSPSESINVGKRKAPDDGFGDQEQVCCPCGAGSCPLLQSNKAQSKGRQYYVCPKDQAERCGFFQWQDQAAHKQPNQGQRDDRVDLEAVADNGRNVQCACGLPANELTSHSAKNPNQVFYKCGNQGQCRFFQWQDELPFQPAAQTPAPAEAHSHHISQQSPEDVLKQLAEPEKPATAAGGSGVFADDADDWGPQDVNDFDPARPTAWMEGHNYANAPAPRQGGNQSANPLSPGHAEPPMQIECNCKLQCTYMMAKTQKNDGRWFYRCPRRDEGQCKFFKWEDEAQQQPTSNGGAPYGAQSGAAPTYQSYASPPKIGAGTGGGSTGTCFKCGEAGHWARDCPGGGNGGGGYNAGGGGYGAGPAGGTSSGAPCFKCGQEGHWARDCPSSGGGRGGAGGRSSYGRGGAGRGGGRTGSSAKGSSTGACYKCGQSGHFSNACPN